MKATIVIVIALAIISIGCQNDMSTNPEQTTSVSKTKNSNIPNADRLGNPG
ncbi:MAG: hypothetical protein JXA60_11635 [Candidatus Coatesbacteria bacterium]|nr:hypothetical protein [Candidatus Coatesbacteria bacterium]